MRHIQAINTDPNKTSRSEKWNIWTERFPGWYIKARLNNAERNISEPENIATESSWNETGNTGGNLRKSVRFGTHSEKIICLSELHVDQKEAQK